MSDRVVVMDRGKIVQLGTPSDLYDHPATPYVANFIGTSNMIPGEVSFTNGTLTDVRFDGGEVRSASGGGRFAVGDKVIAAVRPEKVHLRQAGETRPDHAVISGTVMDSLFHGNSFRLEVDIRQNEPFLVDIQLKTGVKLAQVPTAGSSIDLAIDPATVSLFPAETEDAP
jgi:ABC-type Fe3+/spermidine/putrescine transport system ATPase subunit